ncbi:hypothetical protein STCU_07983 [Strigomonas culicis]|nr:hypothetical protein STCU_07983 [Strigomonas culicis]|eukprot:EPY22976.1 hypothetical protein STCU_07983 [Strigomonas culicis]
MSEDAAELLVDSLSPVDLMKLTRAQKIDLLEKMRAHGSRNPHITYFLATDVLSGGGGSLSAGERYELYEQLLIASLHSGRLDKARLYLNLLEKRFGRTSMRVRRLRGLCYEAEGNIAEARTLYELLRKEDPATDFFVKRLVAMYKSEGKYRDAIALLEDEEVYKDEDDKPLRYLEVHRMGVLDVYQELSHLHYLCGSLDRALYYVEEMQLYDPSSYLMHSRMAELLYAKKDYERCVIEYSQSLLLNPNANNARAAYGLWQVTGEQLSRHESKTHRLDEDKELPLAKDLHEFAAETLRAMYAKSPALSTLEAFLQ